MNIGRSVIFCDSSLVADQDLLGGALRVDNAKRRDHNEHKRYFRPGIQKLNQQNSHQDRRKADHEAADCKPFILSLIHI